MKVLILSFTYLNEAKKSTAAVVLLNGLFAANKSDVAVEGNVKSEYRGLELLFVLFREVRDSISLNIYIVGEFKR